MPQEDQGGKGITGAGSPNMEVTTMVSSPAGATDRSSLDPTRQPETIDGLLRRPTSLVVSGQLQLAAWKLSGVDSLQQEFQQKLPSCWRQDGAQEQILHTKVHGKDGIAGVLKGKLIHFHAPSSPS